MTYEVNGEGKLVNVETGEDAPVLPQEGTTLPDWLWEQHNTAPPKEVEA